MKISRGAYRCLVNADFSDNIAGLRACVTNCCAKAFLNREGDYVVVRPYLLPSGSSPPRRSINSPTMAF